MSRSITTAPTTINNTNQTQSFSTYYDSNSGIKIQYPSDWHVNKRSDSTKIIVGFTPTEPLVKSPVRLGIEFENTPGFLSSINNTQLSSGAHFIIDRIRQSTPDFQLIESSTTAIGAGGNIPAYKIVYTAGETKVLGIITIKNDKMYFILYGTKPAAEYSRYLSIAQKMIDSFEIIK